MNRLHSILFMGSSCCVGFGAVSSRWMLLPLCLSVRSAASFSVTPFMQSYQHVRTPLLRTMTNGPYSTTLMLSTSSGNEKDKIVPTWEYVPYDPKTKQQPKKNNNNKNNKASVWTVPKEVKIPEDSLEISFVRSSGSGGQNVNKLSTKVELRLDLSVRQTWMPAEVQRRLKEQQSNKISKDQILSITSQEHRTQGMNRKSAVDKLRKLVLQAWPRPKIRKQRKGISKAAKARNKEFKKRQSEKKQNRRRVDW